MSHTTVTARRNRTAVTRTRSARRANVTRMQYDARRIGTAGAILAACTAALMFTIGAAYPAHGATDPAPASSSAVVPPAAWVAMLTPCPEEDSSGCYWDADTMGNGQGASFYAVAVTPGAVCVRFWDAHQLDYCDTDGYAPAGAPVWHQVSGPAARAMARADGRTVDYWARCANSRASAIVCPDGARY